MDRISNCVPDYFLEQQEAYNRECERYWDRMDYYNRNKEYRKQKYIEGCNEIQFYPDECTKCNYGEEAHPDSEMDDMPTMICSNWIKCPVWVKKVKESFPNTPVEEIIRWREEYVEKLKAE